MLAAIVVAFGVRKCKSVFMALWVGVVLIPQQAVADCLVGSADMDVILEYALFLIVFKFICVNLVHWGRHGRRLNQRGKS